MPIIATIIVSSGELVPFVKSLWLFLTHVGRIGIVLLPTAFRQSRQKKSFASRGGKEIFATTTKWQEGLSLVDQYELVDFLPSNSTGGFSDMDMRSGGSAGYCVSERDEGDTRFAQLVDEHLSLSAIGMKRDIHGVAMIESEAIVGC
jgi:hypothetical protein